MQHHAPPSLERKLYLQKLKTGRLVEITQAINNNVKTPDLFKIYHDLVYWVLGFQEFVLLLPDNQQDNSWKIAVSQGNPPPNPQLQTLVQTLQHNRRITYLGETQAPPYNYLIPIAHKDQALALLLLGQNKETYEQTEEYDELQYLAAVTNVVLVAIENKRLFKRQLEQEHMKREIDLARQVQQMLIPSELPQSPHYQFAGFYQPYEGGVGGDYYDCIELNEDELFFCIADIAGKGTPAALLMANFQAKLHTLIHRPKMHLRDFIRQLNRMVLKTTKGDRFITLFLARYQRSQKRLLYLRAGHTEPLMFIPSQGIQKLDKGSTFLGIFPELPEVEYGNIQLDEPAFFILYTDGLSELRNHQGQEFGTQALEDFLAQNHQLSPQNFNQKLLEILSEFKGDLPFNDDISLLTARINPQANGDLAS